MMTTDTAFYEYLRAIVKSEAMQAFGDELSSFDVSAANLAWHASSRATLRAKVIREAADEGVMTQRTSPETSES